MESICDFVRRCYGYAKYSNEQILAMEELDLSDRPVKLPDNIGDLVNLKTIYLNNTGLKFLPESFCQLVNLENLSLQYNQLEKLPENIGHLEKLKVVFLDHNRITSLPASFEKLKLDYLDISKNPFTE